MKLVQQKSKSEKVLKKYQKIQRKATTRIQEELKSNRV